MTEINLADIQTKCKESLLDYLHNEYDSCGQYSEPARRILCNNGTDVSIQGGRCLRSTPKARTQDMNGSKVMYTHLELGYPQGTIPEEMKPYAEDSSCYDQTVYNYVPIEIVVQYILLNSDLVHWDQTKLLTAVEFEY